MSASSIDEKIVQMTFKGQSFIDGTAKTVSALTNLRNGLNNLKGAEAGINNLDAAGKRFSLAGMAQGVDSLASKFGTMGIVGITVLSNLVNKAVNAGVSIAKSLTIDPIKQGLDVYETKINAIQTILANTGSAGTTLNQVTAALNQLNVYANKTVYNFGQMAKNIGTFTAAGVDLKTSVASIKGIANLAALSGSSAEQASTAMYQLSQAIANGKVNLQDWNSVVNAGLGGKVFQNALEQTAKATGVHIDAIIKKAGSFRNSLQQGWLTSKILTQTLSTFTGDLTAQQLKSLGYSKAQIPLILAQAKAAQDSATKIRTITQLQAALREEVATAWSTVWQSLIGNIGDATTLLSGIHNVLENLFTKPVYAFNNLLTQFDKLGGRSEAISAIGAAFRILGSVVHQIGSAFREVFPPVTALTLMNIVLAFENLEIALTPTKRSLAEIKSVFVGIFSAIKIVVDVIGALFGGLGQIGGAASGAGTGILGFLAKLGQLISNFRKTIESGNILTRFFNGLGKILALPVRALGAIISAFGGFSGAVDAAVRAVSPFVRRIGGEFSKLGSAIAAGIKSGSFQNVVNLINGTLFATVLVAIKKFFANLGKSSGGGGLLDSIKESFEGLTGALKSMQANLKSGILEKIAFSVALLTASLVALSFIDVANLTKALTAITVLFAQMLTALSVITKVGGSAGILKMAAIGLALNLLATSVVILAGAVAILSRFSWAELERGLGAIGILLAELVTATLIMSANTKGLVASAYSLEIMAVALNILSAAVHSLGSLDFGTLVKGIGSIAALLVLMVAFQRLSGGGKNLISTAAAMVLIGAALNVMSIAVANLGKLSIGTLVKGIAAIGAVLLILVTAMNAMEGSIAGAAALVIASAAILILGNALNSLGGMSWGAIAKSLVVLAGALVLLAASAILMTGALPGAAAMLVMAAALAVLTPILIAFSQLSWEGIAKALVALAGAFVVIAAAGILLTPLVVVLLALGVAITLIGVGVLATAAGVTLFAAGLTLLAISLTAVGAAISAFVTTILGTLPVAINQVANIIIALATGITKAGPAILIAITAVLLALLGAIAAVIPKAAVVFGLVLVAILSTITKYGPKIVTTFFSIVLSILNTIAAYYPRFVSAGLSLIVNLLNGVARQIPRVAASAVNVIVAFINAVGASGLKISAAGINMIINFVNGLASEIRKDTPRMNAAGQNLASAIIQGMVSGIFGGIGAVISAARTMASQALASAKAALGIHSPSKAFDEEAGQPSGHGFAIGLLKTIGVVTDAAKTVGNKALDSMREVLSGIGGAVSDNVELNPVITPVLDLTLAKQGFDQLSGMTKQQIIAATTSSSTASSISAQNSAAASAAGIGTANGPSLNYTQNNYSPVALDATTIYRQTKNQLSVTKGVLANANPGGSN